MRALFDLIQILKKLLIILIYIFHEYRELNCHIWSISAETLVPFHKKVKINDHKHEKKASRSKFQTVNI